MRRKNGFTLIESIITIIVLSIIAFTTMYIMTEGFKTWWVNKNYIELRANGRYALERLAAEFREAQEILVSTDDMIKFRADVDNDGDPEAIAYVDGIIFSGFPNKLLRAETEEEVQPNSIAICDNIDSNNTGFTWDSTLKVLTVDLTLTKDNDTVTLRRKITARNIP